MHFRPTVQLVLTLAALAVPGPATVPGAAPFPGQPLVRFSFAERHMGTRFEIIGYAPDEVRDTLRELTAEAQGTTRDAATLLREALQLLGARRA